MVAGSSRKTVSRCPPPLLRDGGADTASFCAVRFLFLFGPAAECPFPLRGAGSTALPRGRCGPTGAGLSWAVSVFALLWPLPGPTRWPEVEAFVPVVGQTRHRGVCLDLVIHVLSYGHVWLVTLLWVPGWAMPIRAWLRPLRTGGSMGPPLGLRGPPRDGLYLRRLQCFVSRCNSSSGDGAHV